MKEFHAEIAFFTAIDVPTFSIKTDYQWFVQLHFPYELIFTISHFLSVKQLNSLNIWQQWIFLWIISCDRNRGSCRNPHEKMK